jgi:protein-disulfide isomerase
MLTISRLRSGAVFVVSLAVAACGDGTPGVAETAKQKATPAPVVATSAKWVETVAKTPEGGYRIGNPDAPVKLIEFASLTCPHCKDFHEEALSTIKGKYVATGQVSYEFRNFILNPADYAATMLARCASPEAYFALSDAMFRAQAQWLEPFTKIDNATAERLSKLPPDEQIVEYAKTGKLDEFMRARGMPEAKFRACLTDARQRGELEAISKSARETFKIAGTPSFVINGEMQENVFNWESLQPKLDAAL